MNMLVYETDAELMNKIMELEEDFLKDLRTRINHKIRLNLDEVEMYSLLILNNYIDEFSIPVENAEALLASKRRFRQLSYGRNFYCWYVYLNTPYSLDYIGSVIGGKHHATIIHNIKCYVRFLSSNIYEHAFLESQMKTYGLNIHDYHVSKIKQHTLYIEDYDSEMHKRLIKNSLS